VSLHNPLKTPAKLKSSFSLFHFLPTGMSQSSLSSGREGHRRYDNTFHVTPEELDSALSSEIVSQAFAGSRLVKGFNHLPDAQLGTNRSPEGQRQAVFLWSNDADASATVAAVATQLGFAPVELGRIDEGSVPLHVVGGLAGGLLFQNLKKLG
jgi:hypothetical protein